MSAVVSWFAVVWVLQGSLHQDLLPYLAAGDLATEDVGAVYAVPPDGELLHPTFRERVCVHLRTSEECTAIAVPAVSPPIVLPLAIAQHNVGSEWSATIVRLFGAACFGAGFLMLDRRARRVSPRMGAYVALSAVLMTPFVVVVLAIGQTSPALFLVALLAPIAQMPWARTAMTALVWFVAAAFKLFPFALVALAAAARRWRVLAVFGAIVGGSLVCLSLMVPSHVWVDYAKAADWLSSEMLTWPYGLSIQAHLTYFAPDAGEVLIRGATLLLVGAAAALWLFRLRLQPIEIAWPLTLAAVMLAMPIVWWHYGPVVLAAFASVLLRRPAARRWFPALPTFAAALSVMSTVDLAILEWRLLSSTLLFGTLALALWLAATPERATSPSRCSELDLA